MNIGKPMGPVPYSELKTFRVQLWELVYFNVAYTTYKITNFELVDGADTLNLNIQYENR
jgi:hypothetical protein